MPSGRKPDLKRLASMRLMLNRGLSYDEVGQRFGVTKQCVHSLLHPRPRRSPASVPCARCGADIRSPALVASDAGRAVCVKCLRGGDALAVRLRALRLAAGLTKKELDRRAGLSPDRVQRYEERLILPRDATVEQLGRVLPGL